MAENIYTNTAFVIDLDGTLALLPKGSRDFVNAMPNELLIAKLKALKLKGHKLILSSARGDKRRGNEPFDTVALTVMQEISEWLNKHDLIYLFDEIIVGNKRYAELYIDDKGLCPEAFLNGIHTAKDWAEFSKSLDFKICLANWQNKKVKGNTLHLGL